MPAHFGKDSRPPSFLANVRHPHPRGVRPRGNFFFDTNHPDLSNGSGGLGYFSRLDDSLICNILERLDGVSLARLSQTSRAMYCWGYFDEFWKNLVLSGVTGVSCSEGAGSGITMDVNGETIRCVEDREENLNCVGRNSGYGGSAGDDGENRKRCVRWTGRTWRETFAQTLMEPISVSGVYSDLLFQSWMYASMEIKPEWLNVDSIDRRSNLSLQTFIEEYDRPNRPVIIRDVMSNWPAMQWSEVSLVERFGDVMFRAEAMDCTLRDYYRYANSIQEECPMYLFDKFFPTQCPELANEYTVPVYFQEDYFEAMGSRRPDHRWIIIGPERSGSSFHKDPNGTSAWNATITGSKKWIMFPPHIIPPGVHPNADGSEVTTPNSLMEWMVHYYDEAKKLHPIECTTRPGDLIFVPKGWWHMVINLESTIAVTQNFVNRQNLLFVLKFCRNPAWVSGVPCDGTLDFGDLFEQAIRTKYPGLIEQLEKEEEAASKQLPERKRFCFWKSVSQTNQEAPLFDFQVEE